MLVPACFMWVCAWMNKSVIIVIVILSLLLLRSGTVADPDRTADPNKSERCLFLLFRIQSVPHVRPSRALPSFHGPHEHPPEPIVSSWYFFYLGGGGVSLTLTLTLTRQDPSWSPGHTAPPWAPERRHRRGLPSSFPVPGGLQSTHPLPIGCCTARDALVSRGGWIKSVIIVILLRLRAPSLPNSSKSWHTHTHTHTHTHIYI